DRLTAALDAAGAWEEADGGLPAPPDEAAALAEAALLVQKHGRLPAERSGALLHRLVSPELSFGALVGRLPSAALRRDALGAFVAARSHLWSDALIGDLPSLPGQVLDLVAERLLADGRGEALANRFGIFLLTPSRQPETVLRLAGLFAAGRFDGVPAAPTLDAVVMGLLHLVETQAPRAARRDRDARAAVEGAVDVLLRPRRGLLARFVAAATRPQMEAAM